VRVIAGSAGGLRLEVPAHGVRPTMDRVKAAIFSSLGDKVLGARVLDLFAGTGGLGIEALSRGAASAIFVESDSRATKTIERNIATTHVQAQLYARDVFDFLRHASGAFDIIFADPPYERAAGGESFTHLLLNHPTLPALLAPEGIFVLEKRPQESLPQYAAWSFLRARRYGATEVLFLAHAQ
jgi:16S rRNA (guanine966-N2)-methyltransferase